MSSSPNQKTAHIRNDLYANLPAHTNSSSNHSSSTAATPNEMNGSGPTATASHRKPPPSGKEMLYATPLRKSDRFKGRGGGSGEKCSSSKSSSNHNSDSVGDKLNNTGPQQSYRDRDNHHHHHHHHHHHDTGVGPPQPPANNNCDVDHVLGERRILSFLKDTSQLHKKMELHRGFPNSNFSCLAREEHFANLVQQNVVAHGGSTATTADAAYNHSAETTLAFDVDAVAGNFDEHDRLANLECEMSQKISPDKEVGDLICLDDAAMPSLHSRQQQQHQHTQQHQADGPRRSRSHPVADGGNINREWVLKKVALCLEQRSAKATTRPSLHAVAAANETSASAVAGGAMGIVPLQQSHMGCIIMGSNGSGKTTICESILDGCSGTKGLLNRKLLGCYFVNSQNPDCHNLSMFIRGLILQILSHSSYLTKEETTASANADSGCAIGEQKIDNLRQRVRSQNDDDEEELLIAQLRLNEKVAEFCAKKSPTKTASLVRQQSEPVSGGDKVGNPFGTQPPTHSKSVGGPSSEDGSTAALCDLSVADEGAQKATQAAVAAAKPPKSSKIPVKIGIKSPKRGDSSLGSSPPKGYDADNLSSALNKLDIQPDDHGEAAAESADTTDQHTDAYSKSDNASAIATEGPTTTTTAAPCPPPVVDPLPQTPAPLPPKSKSCRTSTADEYYEMLLSNPDILEHLFADNIEKNPDDCFKKALLFPLLELTPPKQALLLLIDSIDENYINEGNLMSTLKGRNSTKSRNIAELLANHIHLFPKWLFLVCTAKKQNKHITRIFSGFKRITLDDLRKSHVVKDVQEYIIQRLNSDFKGTINLSKEIIESLNQLYIKSNGCILYLQKVLNGIQESFFSFREIKLIPCTLNGLYLYICQKSFNKKQYTKIRPILNVLLACSGFVERLFVLNCLRAHNYSIDGDDFDRRIDGMRTVLVHRGNQIRIFHNSFADWLVDVKFATKKFLCDVNEGHCMISMYYTLISETLCANQVRKYIYHLIKTAEYLSARNVHLDLVLVLLESRTNLSDCFYTNLLNCCDRCEMECKNDRNFLRATRAIIDKFLNNELSEDFAGFLCDFFKPNLPTDARTLKLLIETGINNADGRTVAFEVGSAASSQGGSPMGAGPAERAQHLDTELAELLISSERSCAQVTRAPDSPRESVDLSEPKERTGVATVDVDDDDADEEAMMGTKIDGANAYARLGQLSEAHSVELHKGKALIHILANEGNRVLLERALRACKDPIDLEIEDTSGQTALNIAARNGHIEIVALLLNLRGILGGQGGTATAVGAASTRSSDVDVNHADRDGWTPLRSASWGGHTEVVKLLIERPECSIDLADKEERTALRAAAWSGHEDILKLLIGAGANVNSVDRQGRTSLIAASYMGHYEIVELLLESGANVNHLDVDGRSALCVAALCGTSGYSKVISCLLEHGANTDQLDNDGMSPLLVSSFEGNNEVCELLLENGADPDLADFMGRTPLWAACTAGHAAVVKLLLFWGCGIDCMDSEGRTVLSIAAAQGNIETVRQLLDRGLDETHRDNAGWTPLHYAAFEGYADICTQLVESGAKIDECDNEGKTPLHLAAQEGRAAAVEALLCIHSACVDLRAHDGKTSFRLACIEGHLESVAVLLKYGCDVNLKDADSRTTLYILALENKIKIVKWLLEHSNINANIPDSEGRTALHVAAWQGHVDMVKVLITQGRADVNAMDLDCRSPLHSCAWQGNHEVMEILLFCGAMADHACKQGATALGISAQEGHEHCVRHLLQYGANPYKSDHCGRTPIKLAAKSNRNNVLRVLEEYTKSDINFDPSAKPSPLAHIQKSPDKSHVAISQHNPNLLAANTAANNSSSLLNATNSTQSSNNFYENTMHSDHSSMHKRKSVISSQSTGSSNNETPLSFTQQLQRQTRHGNSRHSQLILQSTAPVTSAGTQGSRYGKGAGKHAQMLPNVDEYHANLASQNMMLTNDADLSDLGCMSPLYATPPHSPSSEISSPGAQHPSLQFEDGITATSTMSAAAASGTHGSPLKMDHFTRDTHMRIILGNASKEAQAAAKSSKRSGIATNPAVRMIRNRFDSAAQLIRRTNNILSSGGSSGQGSSSIGVKSGTFQWRKESQM